VRKPQEVSETPSYPQNFKNFLKELKIMINLAKTNQTHHRVHLFDACSEWDRSFYLVLQPVADGSNLEDFMRSLSKESLPDHQRDPPYLVPKRLLQQSRLLDRSDVLRKAVGCLVVSLAALHEAKIAHGDLHRKNILIDNGEVQYTDFGLSISEYRHNSDHMTKEELSKMEESIGPAIPGSLDPYQEDTFCLGGILMKILVAVRPSWPYQPYIWLQLWDICQSLRDHCGKKVSLLEAAKRILPLHEKAEKEFEENFLLAHQELFGKDVPFMPDGNGKLMCGHCELWIKAKQTSLLTNM
jgi:serine/threonine protein kinase